MTTNNHPAKGPVSLDRLHQIIEILSKAAAQSDGGNLGYAMADAVRVIDGAIAAFGAEPVADVVAWNREGEERTCDIRLRRFDLAPGPLFAVAQPAPVVPDEREAFNVWNNDTDCPLAGLTVKQAAWLAWLKRSGTIKSFEPATDEFEVWARSEGLIHDSYGLRTVNTSADVARKAWNACRAAILQAGNSPVTQDCWCRTCRPMTMSDMRFVVCPECGNKRCPHANDHKNDCTGSNEPGQEGSAYPAAPQQDVRLALEIGMSRYAGAMQKLVESGD